jgi:hypothetical protein
VPVCLTDEHFLVGQGPTDNGQLFFIRINVKQPDRETEADQSAKGEIILNTNHIGVNKRFNISIWVF